MQEEKLLRNKRKKIFAGFILFLGLMWLCTVISKSIYASKLPMVTVSTPEQKYIEHIVEAEGIVEAGNKNAVTALSGLRVESLAVHEGDKVVEGDLLFTIDMENVKEIMSEKQTEISKVQLQIDTILQNEELAKQKKALEEERAREDYDALARYQDTIVGRAAEEVARAEENIENSGYEEDQELEDALKSASYGEADAKWNRDNTLKEAGRKVEDILLPENEDSTLDSCRLELGSLQKELSFYQQFIQTEGRVIAEESGTVTDIYISVGSRIPDTAVMLLSDDTVSCQFKVTLTGEQKKYIGWNDEVTLKLEGSSKELETSVDYLAESKNAPGNYEIRMNLPEGVGTPGLSGTMSHSEQGEKYSCCISPLALHKEENRSYVYVMKEREGILGMEYYAEEVNVKVLDENDNFAAVEGALTDDSKIIVSSTKEIGNGDIVRYF